MTPASLPAAVFFLQTHSPGYSISECSVCAVGMVQITCHKSHKRTICQEPPCQDRFKTKPTFSCWLSRRQQISTTLSSLLWQRRIKLFWSKAAWLICLCFNDTQDFFFFEVSYLHLRYQVYWYWVTSANNIRFHCGHWLNLYSSYSWKVWKPNEAPLRVINLMRNTCISLHWAQRDPKGGHEGPCHWGCLLPIHKHLLAAPQHGWAMLAPHWGPAELMASMQLPVLLHNRVCGHLVLHRPFKSSEVGCSWSNPSWTVLISSLLNSKPQLFAI